MNRWDEMRTAYAVAKLGTVSAAADHLGIHRATVVRHIDALEAELGGPLFQRHGRGYTPTEAGEDLVRVARVTEEQFRQLAGRTRGRGMGVTGEIVVTAVELLSPIIMPALQAFRQAHPNTQIRYEASGRVYRLEYGEAHVAIRSGAKPDEPDSVVKPFFVMQSALYAHRRYIERNGQPASAAEYGDHAFLQDLREPVVSWGAQAYPRSRIVLSSRDRRVVSDAFYAGMGISFCPTVLGDPDPELVQIQPPDPAWSLPFWLVTHVDLHRTAKVQAILKQLRALAL